MGYCLKYKLPLIFSVQEIVTAQKKLKDSPQDESFSFFASTVHHKLKSSLIPLYSYYFIHSGFGMW